MSDAYVFDSVLVLATDEKRLVKHLLDNYQRVGRVGRPTGNSTDPTKVTISFGLIELREFDIENQEIVMVGWTALVRYDSQSGFGKNYQVYCYGVVVGVGMMFGCGGKSRQVLLLSLSTKITRSSVNFLG